MMAKSDHNRKATDQAQFFPHHGKNEIRLGLRQEEEFLLAFHQSHSGYPAGTHRDVGLKNLESLAQRVGIRIQERQDPIVTIGGVENQPVKGRAVR